MGIPALGAASSPLQPVPALGIEELLDERGWERRPLAATERRLLQKALEFLQRVEAGIAILCEAAASGTITPDVVSLDAYEYTRHALENSSWLGASSFELRQAVIEQARLAVQALLAGGEAVDRLPEESIQIAGRLFGQLADYSYSRGLATPAM
jgi:hypothetical protein